MTTDPLLLPRDVAIQIRDLLNQLLDGTDPDDDCNDWGDGPTCAHPEAAADECPCPPACSCCKATPAPADDGDLRTQLGQVLRRWGLLDEVNNPKAAEEFAVTDLLAVVQPLRAQLAALQARDTPTWRRRAEQAEAALTRVRALADRWSNALAPDLRYARALAAALDGPEQRAAEQPGQDDPLCTCMHRRSQHVTVSGRLLCDACDGETGWCEVFTALDAPPDGAR